MYKKLIIVFEGIEGSGKSYHMQNISNYLKKNKIKFIKIREPGGSLNSEKIRKLILNKNSKFNKFTDFFITTREKREIFITWLSFMLKLNIKKIIVNKIRL